MCKITKINSSANGLITKCSICKQYHIEYKNLFFTFSYQEYKQYRQYFLEMDAHHWERKNANTHYRRKVVVPMGSRKLVTVFNSAEVDELKRLFSYGNIPLPELDLINPKELQVSFSVN